MKILVGVRRRLRRIWRTYLWSAARERAEAGKALEQFQKRYGSAMREDRKESLLACYYVSKALEDHKTKGSGSEERRSIEMLLTHLWREHPEHRGSIGTIIGWYREGVP